MWDLCCGSIDIHIYIVQLFACLCTTDDEQFEYWINERGINKLLGFRLNENPGRKSSNPAPDAKMVE